MGEKIIDRNGNVLRTGDTVRLVDVPLELFLLRTEPEQNILRNEIGNTHFIQGIDQHGKVKLDFYDKYNTEHSILINASCVVRL